MNSMTGFGSASVENKDFKIELSVKSVNSRFLEMKFYTPPYYFNLEPELQKKISQKCRRGSFIIHISRFPQKPLSRVFLKWNKAQAEKWKNLYQSLSKKLNLKNDLGIKEILHREGVLNLIEKPQNLSRKEKEIVKKSFDKSLSSCLKQRKREGLKLKKDIALQMKSIQSLTKSIELLNKKQKQNFIKKRVVNRKGSPLETEKFDTHEEVVRVKEHLEEMKSIIKSDLHVGRKIDFYTQELLREVNTIGAKATLPKMTLKVVELKFCLEKIKEQIQNIE